MTISLDGFAEDHDGSVGVLYPDLDTLGNTEVMREAIKNCGAVVMVGDGDDLPISIMK